MIGIARGSRQHFLSETNLEGDKLGMGLARHVLVSLEKAKQKARGMNMAKPDRAEHEASCPFGGSSAKEAVPQGMKDGNICPQPKASHRHGQWHANAWFMRLSQRAGRTRPRMWQRVQKTLVGWIIPHPTMHQLQGRVDPRFLALGADPHKLLNGGRTWIGTPRRKGNVRIREDQVQPQTRQKGWKSREG